MAATPDNVAHVGEKTRGGFSTVLTKYLPNDWQIFWSNEVHTDPHGVVWKGKGIKTDVKSFVFNSENAAESHGDAVRVVVDLINEGG